MNTRVLWGVAIGAAVAAAVVRAAARRRSEDARDPAASLARVRALYDRGASRYDLAMDVMDRLLFAGGREWVASRARGEVLETAAGSGRNLPFYAPDVRLTLVDVSPAMLDIARRRAAALGRPVEVRAGDAQALEFPDGSFDTVVCTLGLCTIPDERRAVQEAWRVLRADGRLLLLEHVGSPEPAVRAAQRVLDPIVCLLVSDHLLRDPLPIVQETGFAVERIERHAFGIVEYLAARKPA
jgi:ubiquinone/menaquinone biosynthesis C-methylase UbiE